MTNLATLRSVPFLGVLPDPDLAQLGQHARSRRFRAGSTIFHRDDLGSTLYIIDSGRVKLVLNSPEGREVTVGLLGPGSFFGELALLDGGPRSASVVALTEVEALTLEQAPFLAMLEAHPNVSGALLSVLGARLREADEFIQDILFLDLPARLAKQLLRLGQEYGRRGPQGIRIDLRLSQSELASIAGSTRESVNRCLRAYADRGLLVIDRDVITIANEDELRRRIY